MARDEAYKQAEQKIHRALQSGAAELDLYRLGLMELPEALSNFSQLESLNLGNNKITILPNWIGNLRKLRVLMLNGNQLVARPDSLGRLATLPQLETLSLFWK